MPNASIPIPSTAFRVETVRRGAADNRRLGHFSVILLNSPFQGLDSRA
jgi:hypothetical protein